MTTPWTEIAVPIPAVPEAPAEMPWGELVLLLITCAVGLTYGVSLTMAWWPTRWSDKAKKFSGFWFWLLPAMLLLTLLTWFVDTRWDAHALEASRERRVAINEAEAQMADEMSAIYGVTVEADSLLAVSNPDRDESFVGIIDAAGEEFSCDLYVSGPKGQRSVVMDMSTCGAITGEYGDKPVINGGDGS